MFENPTIKTWMASAKAVIVSYLPTFNMFLLARICAEATFYRNSEI